jgi:hypothetical protein
MTRTMWGRLFGAAGLVLGISLIAATSNAADEVPKDAKQAILKIAAAEEAGKKDDAKKEAETLAKKAGYNGGKPGSCETLMHVFAPRKKGGFGFGEKAKATQDGIELKVQALGSKKPLNKKQMDTEKADIKKMAFVTVAVADVTLAAAPKKDNGKQKAKDWIKWTQEMRDAALQLASAADKGDAKAVTNTSKNLDGSCTSCHEVFRK